MREAGTQAGTSQRPLPLGPPLVFAELVVRGWGQEKTQPQSLVGLNSPEPRRKSSAAGLSGGVSVGNLGLSVLGAAHVLL